MTGAEQQLQIAVTKAILRILARDNPASRSELRESIEAAKETVRHLVDANAAASLADSYLRALEEEGPMPAVARSG